MFEHIAIALVFSLTPSSFKDQRERLIQDWIMGNMYFLKEVVKRTLENTFHACFSKNYKISLWWGFSRRPGSALSIAAGSHSDLHRRRILKRLAVWFLRDERRTRRSYEGSAVLGQLSKKGIHGAAHVKRRGETRCRTRGMFACFCRGTCPFVHHLWTNNQEPAGSRGGAAR